MSHTVTHRFRLPFGLIGNMFIKNISSFLFLFLLFGSLGMPFFSVATLPPDNLCVQYCANPYDAVENSTGLPPPVGMICLCPRDNPEGNEEGIIDRAANWIFYLGVIIAPLFILIGAFMFWTAGGDFKKTSGAKKTIIYAAIGLALALCTKLIYHLIRFLIGQ